MRARALDPARLGRVVCWVGVGEIKADGDVMVGGDGEDVDGFVIGGGADGVGVVDGADGFDLVVQVLRHSRGRVWGITWLGVLRRGIHAVPTHCGGNRRVTLVICYGSRTVKTLKAAWVLCVRIDVGWPVFAPIEAVKCGVRVGVSLFYLRCCISNNLKLKLEVTINWLKSTLQAFQNAMAI